jgi:hypothetical protein
VTGVDESDLILTDNQSLIQTSGGANGAVSACASATTRTSGVAPTWRSRKRAASTAACPSTAGPPLDAYLEAAALAALPDAWLFQSFNGRTEILTGQALSARSALRVFKQRTQVAHLGGDLGCHSCRATGITSNLANGGSLERAAALAGHASTRTTQLCDRRRDLIEPDEVESIRI